ALKDAAAVIRAIAGSAVEISALIGRGALGGDLAAAGENNSDGDVQKALDVIAHESVTAALQGAPVAEVASEGAEAVMRLNPDAPLAVAIDPLDGSSNLGVNMAVGMIFGIRPSIKDPANPLASFTTPG
ncbi:class 1 fructose-bisphosphatase, partial [Staphylococcus coagulans]|nr:class 1 fructose-bisphosphatase [Staphylococcus coagulans]